jgi:hypothetical protein
MKKYATCDIVISPALKVKPTRRRMSQVDMEISTGINAGPSPKPIKLVIKGENLQEVMRLLALYGKTDEEIAATVGKTELAGEVKGKTAAEIGEWVRKNVLAELTEMGKGSK